MCLKNNKIRIQHLMSKYKDFFGSPVLSIQGTGSIPSQGTKIPDTPHRVAAKKNPGIPVCFSRIIYFEAYVMGCCNIQDDSITTWKLENRSQPNLGVCPITAVASVGWCTLKNEGQLVHI